MVVGMPRKSESALLIGLLILSSCVSNALKSGHRGPVLGRDYTLTVVDEPTQERLTVTVVSNSRRKVCVPDMPTQGGYSTASRTQIELSVKGALFYFDRPVLDYCIFPACANPLQKGQSLSGYLPYSGFRLPKPFFLEPKSSSVDVMASWCNESPRLGRGT